MERIICVVGPTATGKTQLSIELCKLLDGEVLSCDSMQLYRGMDIGTAKPTQQEMDGVVHHMIDCVDPREDFSVGRFVEQAEPILQEILARGRTCVIAGGTGLYVDSLIQGRTFAPIPQTGRREALERRADLEGTGALLAYLQSFDPEAAARLHPSDRKRIIRACEVYEETGLTISAHNAYTRTLPPRHQAVWLGLDFTDRAGAVRAHRPTGPADDGAGTFTGGLAASAVRYFRNRHCHAGHRLQGIGGRAARTVYR